MGLFCIESLAGNYLGGDLKLQGGQSDHYNANHSFVKQYTVFSLNEQQYTIILEDNQNNKTNWSLCKIKKIIKNKSYPG